MKIGIDGRFWHSSNAGLSQYTKGMVKALVKLDQRNKYLVFLTTKDFEEWDITAKNFQPVVVDIKHFSLAEQLILPLKLLLYNLDVVYFSNFNYPIFYPRRFIITIHDLAYFYFPAQRLKGMVFKWGYYLVLWMAAHRAFKILVDTRVVKEEIIKRLHSQADKVYVVPLAVDTSRLRIDRKKISLLRKKLNLHWPVIFYVGAWRRNKNLARLLQAFTVIKRKKIEVQLLLGGNPDDKILRLIKKHPFNKDIIVVGFIPENALANYYALSRVCVFPSLYEGFGLPVLEAQYLQVPIVTSNISTLPEVGGKGALYIDPLNVEDIAKKIVEVLSNNKLKEKLIRRGQENFKRFSWEKSARQLYNLFKEVR